MQSKEALSQFLLQNNADGLSQQRVKHIRTALRLMDQVSYYQIEPGQSKLGGLPDLLPQQTFPIDEQGNPYLFVAQLNLAEIAQTSTQLDLPLPPKGLLSFFVDQNLRQANVLFVDVSSKLKTVEFTPKLEMPFLCQRLRYQVWYTHPYHEEYYKDRPEPPSWVDFFLKKKQDSPEILDDNMEHNNGWEAYQDAYEEEDIPKHQVGGHYQTLHDAVVMEPDGIAVGWELLLQIDNDNRLGFSWLDTGRLYFFIKKEALAQQDFSRVMLEVDTH